MIILGRNGILNNLLIRSGIINSPLDLMYNLFGVLVGMVQIMLPFMILPLFSVMRGIDKDLLRASQSLGANLFNTFWKIFLPLSMPGIKAGCLLVFIVSLGFFVTPTLLGGRKTIMISMVIEDQFSWALNWGFSSALTIILLFLTIIFVIVYNKFVGIRRILT
jgi:ABC-type spermidine/putrescine transport system permease subunit I